MLDGRCQACNKSARLEGHVGPGQPSPGGGPASGPARCLPSEVTGCSTHFSLPGEGEGPAWISHAEIEAPPSSERSQGFSSRESNTPQVLSRTHVLIWGGQLAPASQRPLEISALENALEPALGVPLGRPPSPAQHSLPPGHRNRSAAWGAHRAKMKGGSLRFSEFSAVLL